VTLRHLSPDELIAAADGGLSHRDHLQSCESCRTRLDELKDVLSELGPIDVPEPSPLFWTHLSENIRARVAAEPPEVLWRGWTITRWAQLGRLEWLGVGGALTAAAVVMFALVTTYGPAISTDPSDGASTAAVQIEPPDNELASLALPADDPSWALMTDVAGDLDWDGAAAVGLVAWPGAAERALESLSSEEQEALVDVLEEELATARSSL
jgi:hypothetical protein